MSIEAISYQMEDGSLTLRLSGRVDSGNAGAVERALTEIREANPAKAVTVNCQRLEYISSAGLRVLLRLKKAVHDLTLLEVTPEVYDVFEMTGFTEMMDVRKAYRCISVEGCEVIGRGANGEVYRIDPDTIVKVYLNPDALPEIHRERELARTAFVAGVPTAIPYDVVRIEGGGYGSVFELLNASSFAMLLRNGEKTLEEIAQMSVDLLRIIHGTLVKPDSMPDMRAVALDWAAFLRDYLPPAQAEKLCALIEAVPVDNHMLHGDYHIKNVMYQNGESLLIDMDTLCHGHPIFELASMYNAYQGFGDVEHANIDRFLGIPYDTAARFWRRSLELYFDGADEQTLRAAEEKAMVLGYARIMRREIRRKGLENPTGRLVIENAARRLEALLDRVDTLLF